MLPVIWSEHALADLDNLLDYIGERNEAAAVTLHRRIKEQAALLGKYPRLHRPGRVAGTREIVAHPNYIVVYRVLPERVEIAAVLHSRRHYPPDDDA